MNKYTAVLGLTLLTAMVFAQTKNGASKAPKPPKTLLFLTPAQIDPSRLLAPPPPDGSDKQVKEMAEVKHLIKTRTPERFAQAKWDAEHEDLSPFFATLGPDFDLQKLPPLQSCWLEC
jgi:hypothetical protein